MEQNGKPQKSTDANDASQDDSSSASERPSKRETKEKSASAKQPSKRAADRATGAQKSGKAKTSKSGSGSKAKAKKAGDASRDAKNTNRVRKVRIERMMSKAELARRAGLSVLTIDRVEKGLGCRMDTKRKILEALGLSLADRVRVFGEEE